MEAVYASFKELMETLPQEKVKFIAEHGFVKNEDVYDQLSKILRPETIFHFVPYISGKPEDDLTNVFMKFIDHFTNVEHAETSLDDLLKKCQIQVEEEHVEEVMDLPAEDNIV